MHLLRKQDLSVVYFLKNLFSAYSNITVQDGFPDENLELPTISVEGEDIEVDPLELGNRVGRKDRTWFIEVFARNKAQRDELGYAILDALESGIPVYDYDEGFPPDVSPTEIGSISPEDIRGRVVKIFPQLTEKLYWRMSIAFFGRYNPKTT